MMGVGVDRDMWRLYANTLAALLFLLCCFCMYAASQLCVNNLGSICLRACLLQPSWLISLQQMIAHFSSSSSSLSSSAELCFEIDIVGNRIGCHS
ncbi:hypothetical protein BKA81DRAFT_368700 [Phyllosticta paracitricarpa]